MALDPPPTVFLQATYSLAMIVLAATFAFLKLDSFGSKPIPTLQTIAVLSSVGNSYFLLLLNSPECLLATSLLEQSSSSAAMDSDNNTSLFTADNDAITPGPSNNSIVDLKNLGVPPINKLSSKDDPGESARSEEQMQANWCHLDVLNVGTYLFDWVSSTSLDVAYVVRMRALLLKPKPRKWILMFCIVSVTYGIADILMIFAYYDFYVSSDCATNVYAVFNVVLVINELIMHTGVIYVLTYGDLARRAAAAGKAGQRAWLSRALVVCTVAYGGSSILFLISADWGNLALTIVWALNIACFVWVNVFIETLFGHHPTQPPPTGPPALSGPPVAMILEGSANNPNDNEKHAATQSHPVEKQRTSQLHRPRKVQAQ